jgi:Icc-related predicted phosphoesterase
VDLIISHSPPLGVGDAPDDAHRGFESFLRLIDTLEPDFMVHGHIHPHGFAKPDRTVGTTTVVNAIPHRLLEVES